MKYLFHCALILTLGLYFVSVAGAQSQPVQSAVTNPPRYGGSSPAESPYPQSGLAQAQTVPSTLVLPAGTMVQVRLSDMLSSDRNNAGDGFTTQLEQPIISQGWVVSQRGQTAIGRVVTAQKAGRGHGVSQLAVELSELVLVDGQQVPVRTQLVQSSAGTTRGLDAAAVGTTTGVGAIIGGAAGGGEGAAIGAAAGAAAGIVGVLSTRGRATELYPETLLTFTLEEPVTVSTQQSQQAFRPVNPQDYARNNEAARNTPRNFPPTEAYPAPYYGGYPTPYYYPPYYYPSYYYSPYWYYGYYGFGPRIYVGPRAYFGGGYFRRHR